MDGLDKLFEDPKLLKGLLYILGLTLAELLILSILDSLLLKLFELDLLNLSFILLVKSVDLSEMAFLEPLLPVTKETFELKPLPYGL